MVKKECQGTSRTHVARELVEYAANVGNSTGRVIGQGVHEDCDAVRAVSFVSHALVVALILTHRVLDGAFDVVLRHVLALADGDNTTQCGVVLGFRTSCLHGNGNLLAQAGECLGHVAPSLQFGSFAVFKCSSHSL